MTSTPTASAVDVIARAIREAPRVYVEKHGHFKWRVVVQGIGLNSIHEGSVDAADEAADRLREELRAATALTALTAAGFVVTREQVSEAHGRKLRVIGVDLNDDQIDALSPWVKVIGEMTSANAPGMLLAQIFPEISHMKAFVVDTKQARAMQAALGHPVGKSTSGIGTPAPPAPEPTDAEDVQPSTEEKTA